MVKATKTCNAMGSNKTYVGQFEPNQRRGRLKTWRKLADPSSSLRETPHRNVVSMLCRPDPYNSFIYFVVPHQKLSVCIVACAQFTIRVLVCVPIKTSPLHLTLHKHKPQ